MDLQWICLKCGEAHSNVYFDHPTCRRCKWTRPNKPVIDLPSPKYVHDK